MPSHRFLSGNPKTDKEALGSGARAKIAFFRTHFNMIIDVRMGVGTRVYTSNLKVIYSV